MMVFALTSIGIGQINVYHNIVNVPIFVGIMQEIQLMSNILMVTNHNEMLSEPLQHVLYKLTFCLLITQTHKKQPRS
jgi:hypothetical protein